MRTTPEKLLFEQEGRSIMLIRSSLRQARRAPVRMTACFVLMALVCAFLTIGLNLRTSTEANMAAIYESYEVIAVPDFQAYVTNRGALAGTGQHDGYWPCAAEDFDLTPIWQATGVESIDIRNRFGAYVSNAGFQRGFTYKSGRYLSFRDVIRFVYTGEEAVTIPVARNSSTSALPVEILWSAAGYGQETYSSCLSFSNNSAAAFVLEPGQEYIATVSGGSGTQFGQTMDAVKVNNVCLETGEYYLTVKPSYDEGAQWEYFPSTLGPCPTLSPYTEDFWATGQGQCFSHEAEAAFYNLRAVNVVTTGDLTSALPFYNGCISVVEGRSFSREDYDGGNPVCIVSRYLAGLNGWTIGDTIDLSFFQSEYLFSRQNADQLPRYAQPTEGFFDGGSYEIIGFYDGRVTTALNGNGSTQYNEEQGALWIDIYLPEKSVENAPTPKLSRYNTTIRLDPLSGQQFLAEMEDSGLMEPQSEGYELGLTLYDQGLSDVADGLLQLSSISTLTVALSVSVAVLAVIVLAVFHVWRSRREIAVLRSLGVRRGQVLSVILAGLLLVCFLGCAMGAAVGHGLSGWAAQKILASAAEDTGDLSFSANVVENDLLSQREEFSFRQVNQEGAWLVSSLCVLAVMALFSGVLVWLESSKPPLLQLGRKE